MVVRSDDPSNPASQ